VCIGLTCESEAGVGTVFRLFFEPADGDDVIIKREEELGPVLANPTQKTLLVVDDNESINAFVTKVFLQCGWNVITAFSGEEALKRARSSNQIDLAVLDVVMPGMSGIEAATELRKSRPSLPVLIVSGYSEENAFNALSEDEKTKFLVKPFDLAHLKSAVDELYAACNQRSNALPQ